MSVSDDQARIDRFVRARDLCDPVRVEREARRVLYLVTALLRQGSGATKDVFGRGKVRDG